MEFITRELTMEQMKEIYEKWLVKHFPEDEVKPWKSIVRMLEMEQYCGYGIFEAKTQAGEVGNCSKNGKSAGKEENEGTESTGIEGLAGYLFFTKGVDSNMILLDYFAMIESYRNHGLGSRILPEMKQLLSSQYEGILIETEDIAFAGNEAERMERLRRDAFYERAGAVQLELHTEVYGAKYVIWYYPCKEEQISDQKKKACRDNLEKIYRFMIPGEKYEKYVKI